MQKDKRITALILAAVMLVMIVIPCVIFGGPNDDDNQDTWKQPVEDYAISQKLKLTGLRIRQESFGPWNHNFAFGTKTFFDDGLGRVNDEYKNLVGNYFFCVGKHADAQPMLSWSQAFADQNYNVTNLPPSGVMSMDSATTDEERKFNFLIIAFTSAMLGDHTVSDGEDTVKTTSQFAVAATINWAACDSGLFKGNSLEEDWAAYEGTYYQTILKEFATNKPSEVPYNEIKTLAKQWFTEIWNTAKSGMSMEVEEGTDNTILRAKIVEKEDSFYAIIPYPGYTVDDTGTVTATSGANETILADWSTMKANNLTGDWEFEGAHDNAVWFKSPSGVVPDENFASIYWDGEGSQGAMTGKDFTTFMNIGAAQLLTFQCAKQGASPCGYIFFKTQTFFAADFSTKKDILVKVGPIEKHGDYTVKVDRYQHDEPFYANYNVNLIKYDSETGKPLSGAQFDVLERENLAEQSVYSDTDLDKDVRGSLDGSGTQIDTEWEEGDTHDTIAENYTGYDDMQLTTSDVTKYNWKNDNGSQFEKWDDPYNDPCDDDVHVTGQNGYLYYKQTMGDDAGEDLAHYDTRSYNYSKGYCGGHPAPVVKYVEVPEEEYDEEGNCTNEDEIDAAIEYNKKLHKDAWAAWNAEVSKCEQLASEGGFFHSIQNGIAQKALEDDRDEFYRNFISITYDYSAEETKARKGYILHDAHTDDIPIEWRTVTSSEYKDLVGNYGGEVQHQGGKTTNPEDTEGAEYSSSKSGTNDNGTQIMPLSDNHIDVIAIGEKAKASSSNADEDIKIASPSEAEDGFIFEDEESEETSEASYVSVLKNAKSQIESNNMKNTITAPASTLSANGLLRHTERFISSVANRAKLCKKDILDWTFIVYDHRTEGEIHFNKRDLNLTDKQNNEYSSYADANGDGSLEGAVYGLFAAEDITHPDSDVTTNSEEDTGVIFQKDDLVAVSTTDRNGDGSFMAITEAPGYTYNYITGKIQKTDDNWADNAPKNLHMNQTDADAKEQDNERFLGNDASNNELSIADSSYENDTCYKKHSSNQGVDGTGTADAYYPIQNNEDNNGNCWIGRPLFATADGTSYYIKELSRSEGYELSVNGKNASVTNKDAGLTEGSPVSIGTAKSSTISYDQAKEYNIFTVNSADAMEGFDITAMNIPDTATFYVTTSKLEYNPGLVHTELVPVLENVPAPVGSNVLVNGNRMEAEIGDVINLPNGEQAEVKSVSEEKEELVTLIPKNKFTYGIPELTADSDVSEAFIEQINKILVKASLKAPITGAPWSRIELIGTTPEEWAKSIGNKLKEDYSAFNRFEIADIIEEDGRTYAIIRYSYEEGTEIPNCLCDKNTERLYELYNVTYKNGGNQIKGFLYRQISLDQCTNVKKNDEGFATSATTNRKVLTDSDINYLTDNLNNTVYEDILSKMYWIYAEGEYQRDSQGNIMQRTVYKEKEVTGGYEEIVTDVEVPVVQDGYTYKLHISPELIGEGGKTDIKITYKEKKEQQTGYKAVLYAAEKGIISVKTPEQDSESYIISTTLLYENQEKAISDGQTSINPVSILERPIRQRIKVMKDIQTNPDGTYEHDTYGKVMNTKATNKIDNFRFKGYLKSNLERLYRDENGDISWRDRNGNELVPEYRDTNGDGNYDTFVWKTEDGTVIDYPEYDKDVNEDKTFTGKLTSTNVQKLYTEVSHIQNAMATGDIENNVDPDSVTANDELFSYDGTNTDVGMTDRINAAQNTGYTRLLESVDKTVEDGAGNTRVVRSYNYEKFFAALDAADTDKWNDDMHSTFTGTGMANYPGQHWEETFHEMYQKDDADQAHTIENTDGADKDNTAGGDRDKSFKPFAWIRENIFKQNGEEKDYYGGAANNEYIENIINTSDYARANAEASDAVRQFAIDWYLKDEAAKLVELNGTIENEAKTDGMKYSDNIYDEALFNAITKSYNYLKPFYQYDLDTIYSVPWDTSKDGGSDHDYTTLSADTLYENGDTGYYYGISAYLPYGTYVTREVQPSDDQLEDFANKHYRVDTPKEIELPSVYGTDGQPDAAYLYDNGDTPETLASKYHIRFNEEWANNHMDDLRNYIIRAHNYDGDYEVYKYGLDIDKIYQAAIDYAAGTYTSDGFNLSQDEFDPLKNYYNSPIVDVEKDGGNVNSHYHADDKNIGKNTANGTTYAENAIERRYHYGSVSEDQGTANNVLYPNGPDRDDNNPSGFYFKNNVVTMVGNQTAYQGKYAPMLVPWTITEPVSVEGYSAVDFSGYADVKFRNTFYVTKLRIEKVDSETGENILHDDAIFALYGAERYLSDAEINEAVNSGIYGTDENNYPQIGDVKFYTKDTTISGSLEFLEGMKATNIQTARRFGAGELYSGVVPAGTPICKEENQIILTDFGTIEDGLIYEHGVGDRTGEFKVFSTLNEVLAADEEDRAGKSYRNQDTGYVITPAPIGAGTYVLTEPKAPSGYVKADPIAVEVYSDSVSYYKDGDRFSKVPATVYTDNIMK